MPTPPDIPLLFTFYFGDSASTAHQGASRRFKKWSQAFDQWVVQLRQNLSKDSLKQPLLAWRRLVRQCGKMPWQITSADINQHLSWMKQQGFAVSTVNDSIVYISGFYQWCAEQNVDPASPPGFNPAKGAACTKRIPYRGESMWSQDELNALLALYQRDPSPLGKRDYACMLMRLNSGVPLKSLQHLTWGQVEQDGTSAWVRWRRDGERMAVPDDVWQAVLDYLTLSGRLEGMVSGKYIFAPQVQPMMQGSGGKAEDWVEGQPVSSKVLLRSLRMYGRKLGIAETKLSLRALRRTSMRLRLNKGESLEGMQVFMGTREDLKFIKYRLAGLPGLPEDIPFNGQVLDNEIPVPVRGTKPFQGREGTTHGFYSRSKDIQAVRAVMAENIRGMDQELTCLRNLMRQLLEREGDETRLMEAYSLATQRLGQLVSVSKTADKAEKKTCA
jgi:integrase